jgi:RNA polymerase sigma-70 factor (ECF subfamily)
MPLLPETRHSLLVRLADSADADAWAEFVSIYDEAVFRFSRGRGLQEADARDVVQRVWIAVHAAMANWNPSGHVGSFRTWLATVAHRNCMRLLRENTVAGRATGGTSFVRILHEVADPTVVSDEDTDWQRWAFCWAAGQVEREVEAVTWQCFYLTAVHGMPAVEVADQLNVRVGTVYAAKCRVLARIRNRVQELSKEQQ